MKTRFLIAFLLYSGIAGAQNLLKKKVDSKTGDTTQMTRERTLYNPILRDLAFFEEYKVGWRIEKLMVKGHHADTLLFFIHIDGGGLRTTKNDLLVTFADGHTLSLPVRAAWTYQYGGLPADVPYDAGSDTFATYVLNPAAVDEMMAGQIKAIEVASVSGPVDYTVKANRALEIQKYLSDAAKAQ